jgi:hypothetical protein
MVYSLGVGYIEMDIIGVFILDMRIEILLRSFQDLANGGGGGCKLSGQQVKSFHAASV